MTLPSKKLWQAFTIALAAVLAAGVLWFAGTLNSWENTTWDWRVQHTVNATSNVSVTAADSISLVLLDQKSLLWAQETNHLSWPWPREIYGAMVDYFFQGGARSISFDVLFTEPSFYGVTDDEMFGYSIADAGNFIGAIFVHPTGNSVTLPVAEIATPSHTLANVNDIPDPDGVFRRASLWQTARLTDESPISTIPSLGMAAFILGRNEQASSLEKFPQHQILNFPHPENSWPIYGAAAVLQSAIQVLEGTTPTLDPALFKNRHVFFGFSAPGLLDQRATPLSNVSPGVVIHATVLADLLADDFIETVSPVWALLVMFLIAWPAALGILNSHKPWQMAGIFLVGMGSLGVLTFTAASFSLWWPLVSSLLAVALSLTGAIAFAYTTEGKQKRFIRTAFRHYLSPDVIDRIVANPDSLKLGGERRNLTILFSDLEGFTSISEGLDPIELTQLLNEYLTDMTDIILEEGGTLDKYEGDAIIAFWNAPADQPDHAQRGCRAAVRCQRKLTERRAEFVERFGAELKMRIGLNTGPVTVGNLGSKQRFDYTVLGDAANLAARLEGANKVFDTYLMISQATLDAADGLASARHLGDLRVVGRKQAVPVYELDGFAGDQAPGHWETYAQAMAACAEGKVTQAQTLFSKFPDDPAALCWLARLENEQEGFDPIWNLTKK